MVKKNPRLTINLKKLKENGEMLLEMCRPINVSLVGVTKSYSADLKVSQAFYNSGIREFADSRIENIKSLRAKGFDAPFMLLRMPMPSEAEETVAYAESSVNSEITTIRLLNDAAAKMAKKHSIILMVDVGDLREGIWPDMLDEIVPEILKCGNINFAGLGTNLGCYGGVAPSPENLSVLVDIANNIQMKYHHNVDIISAGGTSVLKLIEENNLPTGVNQVRIGEALMSGIDSVNDGRPVSGLWKDAFTLAAEIIEIKTKPSVPLGGGGLNAFQEVQVFEDKGLRQRAILAIGKQDLFPDRLFPVEDGIEILGASSDHFLLDVTDYTKSHGSVAPGDEIVFNLTWDNVLRLTTSHYVAREYI